MDFTDGIQVKQSYPDSFTKYRKMKHMYKFWEQGILVINVDKTGNYTIVPCRISLTSKGYTTSYFDKIYTENGVFAPQEKIFINADIHCPNHSPEILSIQDQFCNDYKPTKHVNLGDQCDNRSVNHWEMSRNGWAIQSNILYEMAYAHYLMRKMSGWATKTYLLFGNHERFVKDFVDKMPQLKELFNLEFVLGIKSLNISVTNLKEMLKMHGITFVHGDFKMFGQRGGTKLEKISGTFGRNTVIGDVHYPSMRLGCCSIGMTGVLDQKYNEKNASKWAHGLGYCNVFDGVPFITSISIPESKCHIDGNVYAPKDCEKWIMRDFQAEISYRYDKK
jgi:hypothetical protein